MTPLAQAQVASVNGVALHRQGDEIALSELRRRACVELLRQRAIACGLLAAEEVAGTENEPCDAACSEAATLAIEALLERDVRVPEPTDDDCRRYHAAHPAEFRAGERAHVRHILFALTPGMDVSVLLRRAQTCLLDVRCHDGHGGNKFAPSARDLSNCPSGAQGGDLGWLTREDCAPEFARAVFGQAAIGVLPELIHTRFGLHVVEVLGREAGDDIPFEGVRHAVETMLRQRAYVTALRQYLGQLEKSASLAGVTLEPAG